MSKPTAAEEKLFKIVFDLEPETDTWPPFAAETLWCAKTDVKYEVEVRNIPLYVRGVSCGDRILVRADHDRRELVYERLVAESGHSTVRIIVMEPSATEVVEAALRASDCTWEVGTAKGYLAVDVPLEADYANLRGRLQQLRSTGLIGLEESAISTHHQQQLPSFP